MQVRHLSAVSASDIDTDTDTGGPTTPTGAVHVVADSDTRWKWGAALAARLHGPEGSTHGHLVYGRATPTDRQLAEVAAVCSSWRRVAQADVVTDPDIAAGDVVVLACVGGTVQALMHGMARAWAGRPDRPIVVTGYVGLVYEHLVDGLLLRAGADVLLANSARDAARFRAVFAPLGIDDGAILESALPFLGGATHDPSAAGRDRPFTVSFVSQPSVPPLRDERQYLLDRVFRHAVAHPERRVIVKLRSRPGEQTTHTERHHYARLDSGAQRPANVEFAYGSMSDVLDETDLCVTVSSTAALEAMYRRIPTVILTDLGIRESLGNHVFLDSGCLASWTEIDCGVAPTADPDWAAANGLTVSDTYSAVRQRLGDLRASGPLPALRPWYDPVISAGYVPRLLARNGFDIDGTSLMPERTGRVTARVGRSLTARGARRVYRVGVQWLEPVVRRWAQL